MTALRLCWTRVGRLRYISRHSPAGIEKPTFLPCTCETVFTMYALGEASVHGVGNMLGPYRPTGPGLSLMRSEVSFMLRTM
jgi:hypothetical protein